MFRPLELDSEEMIHFSYEVYVWKGGKFLLKVFLHGFFGTEVNEVINKQSKVELIFPSGFPRKRQGLFGIGSRPHYRRKLVAFINQCLGDLFNPYSVRLGSQYVLFEVLGQFSGGQRTYFCLKVRLPGQVLV